VVLETAEPFQLREPGVSCVVVFSPKNDVVGAVLSNNKLGALRA
jgi:hypothetical protein